MSKAGDVLKNFNEADFDSDDLDLLKDRIKEKNWKYLTVSLDQDPDSNPTDEENIERVESYLHDFMDDYNPEMDWELTYDNPIYRGSNSGKWEYVVKISYNGEQTKSWEYLCAEISQLNKQGT